jgi:hypothetical protein
MIKVKARELILFVLLKLFISKLFRLGFNLTSYFEYCRGNHCKEGMVIRVSQNAPKFMLAFDIEHVAVSIPQDPPKQMS